MTRARLTAGVEILLCALCSHFGFRHRQLPQFMDHTAAWKWLMARARLITLCHCICFKRRALSVGFWCLQMIPSNFVMSLLQRCKREGEKIHFCKIFNFQSCDVEQGVKLPKLQLMLCSLPYAILSREVMYRWSQHVGRKGRLGWAAPGKILSWQLKSHEKQVLHLWTSLPDWFRKTKQMSQMPTSWSAKCTISISFGILDNGSSVLSWPR